jgi:alanine dehydrogenase
MSEVAGRLSIQAGATALQKANGGRGVLLGGVPGVLPGKVAVIGGGVVGLHAAKMAAGLGADVTIIDRSIPRLRQLDDIFNGRVHTRYSTVEALEEECFSADIVVGAVLIPGAAAPKLVSREMLSGMKKARCWSTSPSTRAAASRPRTPRPMPTRPTKSTASSTTASPTCRAPCRSPRRMR